MNKVILIGNVASTQKLNATTVINMATNEVFKDKEGNKVTHTEWWSIKTFGKLSEIVDAYIKKGDLIYVEGRQRTEKANNEKEYKHIYADVIKMLSKKDENTNQSVTEPDKDENTNQSVTEPDKSETLQPKTTQPEPNDLPF